MKPTSVTVRLDPDLARLLTSASRRLRRSRSDLVRDAIRRQLLLLQFEALRSRMVPLAEAAGFITDEDVFDAVS